MGQDIYQFTTVPRKFKYDCWKWQLQPSAAGGISPEKQELFALDNSTVGDENTCALSAQDFEARFQVRYLLWQ